jgi:hypothetical protein
MIEALQACVFGEKIVKLQFPWDVFFLRVGRVCE